MTALARPVRVLFLLQRPEAWGNVASIWRAMAHDPAFEPVAWLLPYNAEDMALSIQRLPTHRGLLASQGVPWVEWSPGLQLTAGQFDVVVFTHPYDRERPRELWFDRVHACVPKIVYVPYGLSVGAGAKNLRLQFAQPLQLGADLVVARSPAEKAMYAQYCPAGDARVQVLGHPRFDRLLEELSTVDTSALEARIGGRTAILWNSHFSFGHRFSQSSNFSTFDLLGPELLDHFAAHRATLCLLWRPHPGLFPELLRQGVLAAELLPLLRKELEELGVVLDEQADHLPAFACSQAMISDPGSFLFEYLATGKPLLPLINPEGELLNAEATSLVAACGEASSFEVVRNFIAAVANGSMNCERYQVLRAQHLPQLDGRAGLRVCEVLLGRPMPVATDADLVNGAPVGELDCPIPPGPVVGSHIAAVCMPPVLARLQVELRRIREEKAAQPSWRKWIRGQFNRVRTEMTEQTKNKVWLMALADRTRRM